MGVCCAHNSIEFPPPVILFYIYIMCPLLEFDSFFEVKGGKRLKNLLESYKLVEGTIDAIINIEIYLWHIDTSYQSYAAVIE